MLREVTMKIRLERISIQKGVTVEALLNSRATELVISSKFARKQGFRLNKMEKPIHIRNMNSFFNKEEHIEHTVEINIHYQGHRERIEIEVIGEQMSRSLTVNSIFYSLFTLFYFFFSFSFIFYFQNNSGQGISVMLSHQSQIDGEVTRLIMGHRRMEQKVLE